VADVVVAVLLFVLSGALTVSLLAYIPEIGKPREIPGPGTLAVTVAVLAAVIVVMCVAGVRLL